MSETQKLISVVEFLCGLHARPVSTHDLKSFFRQHPDKIPQLHQRLGQLLIKAARPYRHGKNPLRKIGLIGNQTYYAVGAGNWVEVFERHKRLLRMQEVVSWRLPELAAALLDTDHEKAARNAMAGFIKEWSSVAGEYQPMVEQINEAGAMAAAKFQNHSPDDLVDRKSARSLLLRLVASYDGKIRAKHFNPNRPLAMLRWPQSGLFKAIDDLVYSKAQIEAFARWKAGVEGRERLYLSFYDPTALR